MSINSSSFLHLLQLASPTIPIGAYSYSEGIENLVENKIITTQKQLQSWLTQELTYGSIRIESAIMLRGYRSLMEGKITDLIYWNNWLSAAKETSELRQQSWQMGQSLFSLLINLHINHPSLPPKETIKEAITGHCNYGIAFAIGAAYWQLPESELLLSYLHSWATNLITAGVKLIPLGQTQGQQILVNLSDIIINTHVNLLKLQDEELFTSNWGLTLASMNHQDQYTRLFRS